MLLVSTYVAASAVEGVGVFAGEPIKKGDAIWRFEPTFDRLIPVDKYLSSPPYLKELLDRYAYPSPDKPDFIVYEVDNGRFMNHSETPNTDFSEFGGAVALRDIKAGEELTCNYADFFTNYELLPNIAEKAKAVNS